MTNRVHPVDSFNLEMPNDLIVGPKNCGGIARWKDPVSGQLMFPFQAGDPRPKFREFLASSFTDRMIKDTRTAPFLDLLEILPNRLLDRKMDLFTKGSVCFILIAPDAENDGLRGQFAGLRHFKKCRKYLPVREIAGSPKMHKRQGSSLVGMIQNLFQKVFSFRPFRTNKNTAFCTGDLRPPR